MTAQTAVETALVRGFPVRASGSALLLLLFLALAIPTLLIPWFIPVRPSRSLSYAQGFSNPALWVLIVGLLIVPTIAFVRSRFGSVLAARQASSGEEITEQALRRMERIGWRSYMALAAFFLVLSPHLSGYFDAEYFLMRAALILEGKAPYLDFEYAYGPALLYPLVGLERLGLPAGPSLAALVLLESAAGYAALHALVHWIMPARPARYTFACLLIATAPSLLIGGANYTFFRFAFAACIACWLVRRLDDRRAHLAALLCGPLFVLAWSISPDVAIAVAGAFGFLCMALSGRIVAACALAGISLAGAVALTPSIVASYLTLFEFGGGGHNIPAYPSAHVLFFAGSIFLSSLYVGTKSIRTHPEAWFVFIYSVLLLPGALGRSDPLHVVFYGFGFVILGASYLLENQLIGQGFRRFFKAYVWIFLLGWIALHVFFTSWSMASSLILTTASAVRQIHGEVSSSSLRALEASLRPSNLPPLVSPEAARTKLFVVPPSSGIPETGGFSTYYVALENAASDRAYQKLVDQIRGSKILIKPTVIPKFCDPEMTEFNSVRLLFPTGIVASRNDDKLVAREFCSLLSSATLIATHGKYVELSVPASRVNAK